MSAESAHLSTFDAETETEAEIWSTSTCSHFFSWNYWIHTAGTVRQIVCIVLCVFRSSALLMLNLLLTVHYVVVEKKQNFSHW